MVEGKDCWFLGNRGKTPDCGECLQLALERLLIVVVALMHPQAADAPATCACKCVRACLSVCAHTHAPDSGKGRRGRDCERHRQKPNGSSHKLPHGARSSPANCGERLDAPRDNTPQRLGPCVHTHVCVQVAAVRKHLLAVRTEQRQGRPGRRL